MAHDIFVSYSSKDKTIADALVAALEKNQNRCWYAPRDIKPGTVWGDEIAKAIEKCKIFLIIFSGSANKSQRVNDELNLAITKEVTILPFRVENLEPVGAMELHLSTRHWLDAYSPSWEKNIDTLVTTAESFLQVGSKQETSKKEEPKPVASVTKKKKVGKEEPKIAASVPKKKESKKQEPKQGTSALKKNNTKLIAGIGIAAVLILAAVFGLPKLLSQKNDAPEIVEEEMGPTPSIFPNEVPEPVRTLEDSDSSLRASEHRVLSGDNFLNNLYERPFTSVEMIYQPYLDIYTVDFAYDEEFFYFTINLNGVDEQSNALPGWYGIEFDRTLTGRGDMIVYVQNPAKDWSLDGVVVLTDINSDVGGIKPIVADEGFKGTGYDENTVLDGELVAFARLSPTAEDSVQIAVSNALLDHPEGFLWGAWADNGLKDFGEFDYNDSITLSEAGSPFSDNEDYPINGLFSTDNTCRLPYGFGQEGGYSPGICRSGPSSEGEPGITCPPGCYFITDHCECLY